MPIYDYSCKKCGKFEIHQRITEEPLKACPTCGGSVERLISSNPFIIYKCDGFHNTDYRSESYLKAASSDKPKETSSTKDGRAS
jgi:putative FmdB family regulatory protein